MWRLRLIPYDKNDPNRVQRWIDWLDSPYWEGRSARRLDTTEEEAAFEAAMNG